MLYHVMNTLEPPGALLVGPCAWHGARKVTTPWSLELGVSLEVGSFHRSCYVEEAVSSQFFDVGLAAPKYPHLPYFRRI